MKLSKIFGAITVTFVVLGLGGVSFADTAAMIIPQESVPVQVYEYATDFDNKGEEEFWVEHVVRYKNVSGKPVVTVRFGFLELGGFNELLGGAYWQILEKSSPNEKEKAVVTNKYADAVFFQEYGTGLVWVDAVRYKDGSIWQADRSLVLEELQKTRPEMTAQDLAQKKKILAP